MAAKGDGPPALGMEDVGHADTKHGDTEKSHISRKNVSEKFDSNLEKNSAVRRTKGSRGNRDCVLLDQGYFIKIIFGEDNPGWFTSRYKKSRSKQLTEKPAALPGQIPGREKPSDGDGDYKTDRGTEDHAIEKRNNLPDRGLMEKLKPDRRFNNLRVERLLLDFIRDTEPAATRGKPLGFTIKSEHLESEANFLDLLPCSIEKKKGGIFNSEKVFVSGNDGFFEMESDPSHVTNNLLVWTKDLNNRGYRLRERYLSLIFSETPELGDDKKVDEYLICICKLLDSEMSYSGIKVEHLKKWEKFSKGVFAGKGCGRREGDGFRLGCVTECRFLIKDSYAFSKFQTVRAFNENGEVVHEAIIKEDDRGGYRDFLSTLKGKSFDLRPSERESLYFNLKMRCRPEIGVDEQMVEWIRTEGYAAGIGLNKVKAHAKKLRIAKKKKITRTVRFNPIEVQNPNPTKLRKTSNFPSLFRIRSPAANKLLTSAGDYVVVAKPYHSNGPRGKSQMWMYDEATRAINHDRKKNQLLAFILNDRWSFQLNNACETSFRDDKANYIEAAWTLDSTVGTNILLNHHCVANARRYDPENLRITNSASDKCVDIMGGRDGTDCIVWAPSGCRRQEWLIEEVKSQNNSAGKKASLNPIVGVPINIVHVPLEANARANKPANSHNPRVPLPPPSMMASSSSAAVVKELEKERALASYDGRTVVLVERNTRDKNQLWRIRQQMETGANKYNYGLAPAMYGFTHIHVESGNVLTVDASNNYVLEESSCGRNQLGKVPVRGNRCLYEMTLLECKNDSKKKSWRLAKSPPSIPKALRLRLLYQENTDSPAESTLYSSSQLGLMIEGGYINKGGKEKHAPISEILPVHFLIKNEQSGRVVTVVKGNVVMEKLAPPGRKRKKQTWIYDSKERSMQSALNGKVLDIGMGSCIILKESAKQQDSQQWITINTDSSAKYIFNQKLQKTLDIAGGPGGRILLAWDMHGGANQKFVLDPVDVEMPIPPRFYIEGSLGARIAIDTRVGVDPKLVIVSPQDFDSYKEQDFVWKYDSLKLRVVHENLDKALEVLPGRKKRVGLSGNFKKNSSQHWKINTAAKTISVDAAGGCLTRNSMGFNSMKRDILASKKSIKMLSRKEDDRKRSEILKIWPFSGQKGQIWKLKFPCGNFPSGSFHIVSKITGERIKKHKSSNSLVIVDPANDKDDLGESEKKDYIFSFKPDSCMLQCLSNGDVMDVNGGIHGTDVTLYQQHGYANQQWKYNRETFHIYNPGSPKVLSIVSTGEGKQKLVKLPVSDTKADLVCQQFELIPVNMVAKTKTDAKNQIEEPKEDVGETTFARFRLETFSRRELLTITPNQSKPALVENSSHDRRQIWSYDPLTGLITNVYSRLVLTTRFGEFYVESPGPNENLTQRWRISEIKDGNYVRIQRLLNPMEIVGVGKDKELQIFGARKKFRRGWQKRAHQLQTVWRVIPCHDFPAMFNIMPSSFEEKVLAYSNGRLQMVHFNRRTKQGSIWKFTAERDCPYGHIEVIYATEEHFEDLSSDWDGSGEDTGKEIRRVLGFDASSNKVVVKEITSESSDANELLLWYRDYESNCIMNKTRPGLAMEAIDEETICLMGGKEDFEYGHMAVRMKVGVGSIARERRIEWYFVIISPFMHEVFHDQELARDCFDELKAKAIPYLALYDSTAKLLSHHGEYNEGIFRHFKSICRGEMSGKVLRSYKNGQLEGIVKNLYISPIGPNGPWNVYRHVMKSIEKTDNNAHRDLPRLSNKIQRIKIAYEIQEVPPGEVQALLSLAKLACRANVIGHAKDFLTECRREGLLVAAREDRKLKLWNSMGFFPHRHSWILIRKRGENHHDLIESLNSLAEMYSDSEDFYENEIGPEFQDIISKEDMEKGESMFLFISNKNVAFRCPDPPQRSGFNEQHLRSFVDKIRKSIIRFESKDRPRPYWFSHHRNKFNKFTFYFHPKQDSYGRGMAPFEFSILLSLLCLFRSEKNPNSNNGVVNIDRNEFMHFLKGENRNRRNISTYRVVDAKVEGEDDFKYSPGVKEALNNDVCYVIAARKPTVAEAFVECLEDLAYDYNLSNNAMRTRYTSLPFLSISDEEARKELQSFCKSKALQENDLKYRGHKWYKSLLDEIFTCSQKNINKNDSSKSDSNKGDSSNSTSDKPGTGAQSSLNDDELSELLSRNSRWMRAIRRMMRANVSVCFYDLSINDPIPDHFSHPYNQLNNGKRQTFRLFKYGSRKYIKGFSVFKAAPKGAKLLDSIYLELHKNMFINSSKCLRAGNAKSIGRPPMDILLYQERPVRLEEYCAIETLNCRQYGGDPKDFIPGASIHVAFGRKSLEDMSVFESQIRKLTPKRGIHLSMKKDIFLHYSTYGGGLDAVDLGGGYGLPTLWNIDTVTNSVRTVVNGQDLYLCYNKEGTQVFISREKKKFNHQWYLPGDKQAGTIRPTAYPKKCLTVIGDDEKYDKSKKLTIAPLIANRSSSQLWKLRPEAIPSFVGIAINESLQPPHVELVPEDAFPVLTSGWFRKKIKAIFQKFKTNHFTKDSSDALRSSEVLVDADDKMWLERCVGGVKGGPVNSERKQKQNPIKGSSLSSLQGKLDTKTGERTMVLSAVSENEQQYKRKDSCGVYYMNTKMMHRLMDQFNKEGKDVVVYAVDNKDKYLQTQKRAQLLAMALKNISREPSMKCFLGQTAVAVISLVDNTPDPRFFSIRGISRLELSEISRVFIGNHPRLTCKLGHTMELGAVPKNTKCGGRNCQTEKLQGMKTFGCAICNYYLCPQHYNKSAFYNEKSHFRKVHRIDAMAPIGHEMVTNPCLLPYSSPMGQYISKDFEDIIKYKVYDMRIRDEKTILDHNGTEGGREGTEDSSEGRDKIEKLQQMSMYSFRFRAQQNFNFVRDLSILPSVRFELLAGSDSFFEFTGDDVYSLTHLAVDMAEMDANIGDLIRKVTVEVETKSRTARFKLPIGYIRETFYRSDSPRFLIGLDGPVHVYGYKERGTESTERKKNGSRPMQGFVSRKDRGLSGSNEAENREDSTSKYFRKTFYPVSGMMNVATAFEGDAKVRELTFEYRLKYGHFSSQRALPKDVLIWPGSRIVFRVALKNPSENQGELFQCRIFGSKWTKDNSNKVFPSDVNRHKRVPTNPMLCRLLDPMRNFHYLNDLKRTTPGINLKGVNLFRVGILEAAARFAQRAAVLEIAHSEIGTPIGTRVITAYCNVAEKMLANWIKTSANKEKDRWKTVKDR
eukprot:jgi/Bigna1/72183/fgenesh1_pg.18_\